MSTQHKIFFDRFSDLLKIRKIYQLPEEPPPKEPPPPDEELLPPLLLKPPPLLLPAFLEEPLPELYEESIHSREKKIMFLKPF